MQEQELSQSCYCQKEGEFIILHRVSNFTHTFSASMRFANYFVVLHTMCNAILPECVVFHRVRNFTHGVVFHLTCDPTQFNMHIIIYAQFMI